jgi:hypothetical protein
VNFCFSFVFGGKEWTITAQKGNKTTGWLSKLALAEVFTVGLRMCLG